jgi:hypothetical protein
MTRKVVFIVLIVPLGGIGAWLVAGDDRDDLAQGWLRSHHEIIQDQLADQKDHLQAYRKAHGRYPTNDEGLAALDNFESRFKAYLRRDQDDSPDELAVFDGVPRRGFWQGIKSVVQDARRALGRAPGSASELFGTPADDLLGGGAAQLQTVQVAVTKRDNIFLVSPAGVFSPWQLPYVYENHRGCAAAFADSPAERDEKGRFSVRVDEDIYVSSIGGEHYAGEIDALRRADLRTRLIGGGLILVAVVLVALLFRAKARAGIVGVVALLASGGAGVAYNSLSITSCYIMSPLFRRRDPAMVVRQKELLQRFHAAGAINDATYRKSLSALAPRRPGEGGAPPGQPE